MLLSVAMMGQGSEEASNPEDAVKDTSWTTGGTLGLNFSQVYLNNWAAGGQTSVSATGIVNLFGNYAKGRVSWDNTLDVAYGVLKQGDTDFIKSDDKLDFSSKFGYKTDSPWYYSALLNFRSQFSPGYDDPLAPDSSRNLISDILAPAYGLLSLGMDYKPNENFSVLIAPLTLKVTIVGDQDLADAGAYGVDPAEFDELGIQVSDGDHSRGELGGYIKMMYKTDVVENVSLLTKLDLFSNYQVNPGNIDVNWEVLISMKVNSFLTTTIATQLLYDDDINITREDGSVGPDTQFKEVLSLGISYTF
jgi:hypothetical protein